jgi:hypothetical protein
MTVARTACQARSGTAMTGTSGGFGLPWPGCAEPNRREGVIERPVEDGPFATIADIQTQTIPAQAG